VEFLSFMFSGITDGVSASMPRFSGRKRMAPLGDAAFVHSRKAREGSTSQPLIASELIHDLGGIFGEQFTIVAVLKPEIRNPFNA
jgi:hypothetical protein